MKFKIGDVVTPTNHEYIGVIISRDERGFVVWWNDGDITEEREGEDMQRLTSESKINLKNT